MFRKYKLNDKVRIVRCHYNTKYIGMIGQIIWLDGRGGRCQITTLKRPTHFGPKRGPWIVTVGFNEIELFREEGNSTCKHWWILDKDNQGECKYCHAKKDFRTLLVKEGVLSPEPAKTKVFGV